MKDVVTLATLRRSVLVTGFGAFPGAPTNPTRVLLRRLERHARRFERLGIDLCCAELPVVYDEIDDRLAEAVARCGPDIILHLGLASRRRHLSVETRACNRAGPLHPDAAGRRPNGARLAPAGPAHLRARWPAAQVVAALRREGLDARPSMDAGDYVCNATLYASLAADMAPRVGFLHVPRVHARGRPRAGRPTMDQLARASVAAVIEMVRESRAGLGGATRGVPSARADDAGPFVAADEVTAGRRVRPPVLEASLEARSARTFWHPRPPGCDDLRADKGAGAV